MGTNDTMKASRTLYLGFERSDKSIQYIKLPNYRNNVTASDARAAMVGLTSAGLLLDSKTGETFSDSAVLTAYTEEKASTYLDIS